MRNVEGNTPLSVAVRNGHRNMVLNLIQSGADVNVEMFPYEEVKEEKEEKKEEKKKEGMKWLPTKYNPLPQPKGTHIFIQVCLTLRRG